MRRHRLEMQAAEVSASAPPDALTGSQAGVGSAATAPIAAGSSDGYASTASLRARLGSGDARLGSEALLLVETSHRQKLVAACCARAEQAGVHQGMSLAHARSILPGRRLLVLPFTPEEDAADLERLAQWSLRFAPVVAADPPDGLMLNIAGCEHLYGGEERLAARIAASLKRLGLPCRWCAAPTFRCAHAVSRFGTSSAARIEPQAIREALAPLPIAALGVEPAAVHALGEIGIESIGGLFLLPRRDLPAHFGGELIRRLDEALGLAPELVTGTALDEPLMVSRTFDGPVLNLEVLQAATRGLLTLLVDQLEQRGCGLRNLRIEFHRISLPPAQISLPLSYPTREYEHLWRLIAPRLERVHLGHGVEAIHLQAARTAPLIHDQMSFWHEAAGPDLKKNDAHLGKLVDQLVERLGAKAVTRVACVERFLPEAAFHRQTLEDAPAVPRRGIHTASRPTRLFAAPEPAGVVALVPDGPPAWLSWRGRACTILAGTGPERISPPWWEQDPPAPTRDYYEVGDDLGRWLWVFRERGTSRWFVHGEWA